MKIVKMMSLAVILAGFGHAVAAHAGILPQLSPMMFQIVQASFDLDGGTVREAHLVQDQEKGYVGLEIELKEAAAKAFGEMTAAGVGKSANIVINHQIVSMTTIQSALGPKILVTGITQYDAVRFINMLKVNQAKESHKKPIVFE